MNKKEIDSIISKIEKEDSIFAKKASLDSLSIPSNIIGRTKQAEQLIRYLVGYKQGYVVPYISVYGRSGAGKSSVVRFVCNNVSEISCCFVNLRQAKTVFGAANLILGELGASSLKSAQGVNYAIDVMEKEIRSKLQDVKLYVLVLDELDVIFYDKRGKPSDFIFKLTVLEEKLREDGILLCIIGISNNVLSEYDLDDRVRSRIGMSEIFFEPYSKSEVLDMIRERASEAFAKKVDAKVLEHCAELSSAEHGDARRAIDLLRVSAEIASIQGRMPGVLDVDLAQEELQKDRVEKTLSSASYHLKLACGALARISYLDQGQWYSTSVLYKQYCLLVEKSSKPLSYRRVSELFTELENTGLVISQTGSKGRQGYGTQYKLVISPEVVGKTISEKWWNDIVSTKMDHQSILLRKNLRFGAAKTGPLGNLMKSMDQRNEDDWNEYVGL